MPLLTLDDSLRGFCALWVLVCFSLLILYLSIFGACGSGRVFGVEAGKREWRVAMEG